MPKARRKLSDLVQEETRKPAEQAMQEDEPTDLQTSEHRNSDIIDSTDLQPHDPTASANLSAMKRETAQIPASLAMENTEVSTENEVTELQSHEVPKYLQLERKETKLWPYQLDALNELTRKLNRKRGKKGERLTDNTLIRVAVDLLLSQAGRLEGVTEKELKKSVSLEVTE